MNSISRTIVIAALGALIFIAIGIVAPSWLLFTMTKAVGFGLVALGLVGLMRGGLLSFGQGLYYCGGAYVSGLLAHWAGVTNIVVLLVVGFVAGGLIAAVVSPFVARYRGIFFAMLTMAISMVAYGVLAKIAVIGGTDGFNVPKPTLFAFELGDSGFGLYSVAVVTAAIAAALCRTFFDSRLGLLVSASRENELRLEYLGSSVYSVSVRNFILAGALAGLGGTLNGIALGHVDPFFSYWTTSGEMVFIAILGGYASVTAVFGTALITELVRSFSGQYFPESWQMLLGIFLLLVIAFLPRGVGSLWARPTKASTVRVEKESTT
ncbi:branched-chain amino acid ABC transporter permease [Rhizobium sp. CECT 9324]|uniref:branched-chain amino acid ABC transporter permease n=1 Tax=Rhizobium sp. CECT 9324 TaxID=2845820 RepID=UPI001E33F796|nr:branched-chain amino acid ABC transporter permease [Rhizobium sp. CECT 9324]CAH0338854.1 hypothetical protein RHI9324_00486 [Rhizobium sp. CECT 9324]